MAILGFELEEIARIVALVESRGLAELVIEEEGRYLRVRGPLAEQTKSFATSVTPPMIAAPAPVQAPAVPAAPTKRKERRADSNEEAPGRVRLTSPMVGVFYRSEKPGAPPLVNVGDRVEVGQTVGVLEAMKVFSEFKSEYAGVVVAILVEDGQLVEAGTPLMVIQTDNS
ncbi:acetyl-CoA carboxylase, biotin carboxyl carrier protein [Chthonomonas calidirosea]|uniref:Biotin carboxyl carrier protein of acetyl-CoA carboxylase n=1 Tax=Chthonomonas calidirosea (strain DSM 23976 / ICMP 18418 / T49) TaxID=1303518 RepID=S0ETD7_CHTCT|nr:acetyl-CoA carboxylase biotin carboxyl carrier protein [Chthonomonas calidirosea]CCW34711.1 biotin carboxyl carrier protein [Chthonomonas calidirosea T49]CEK12917.1 acetyl-CoA carboxylase, biotin carboxyl carrier protein [Chthonomonas calidirosea]CEK12918.1 acetyl-CoA carboxylase, biotin carboxyl carrier protein [Chthonomonas calidirosea]CEK14009.1 acetyl-CoA carboxylase, biotin carboxyl carrier protein [Chthonomonas calidirosea]